MRSATPAKGFPRSHLGRIVIGVPEPFGPMFAGNIIPQGPSPKRTTLLVISLNISTSFDVNTHASRCPRHCVAMHIIIKGAEANCPLTIGLPTPEFMWTLPDGLRHAPDSWHGNRAQRHAPKNVVFFLFKFLGYAIR